MFNSLIFWVILSISVPTFWLTPQKFRMYLLACISIIYIFYLDPVSCLWLLAWSYIFFISANAIQDDKSPIKKLSSLLVVTALAVLIAYKYITPIFQEIFVDSPGAALLIPLGISYYTFKLIHYIVEKQRGNIKDRSFGTFSCYLFCFPIFTAGPIERYDHFLQNKEDKWHNQMAIEGITRIVQGLIKKGFLIGAILLPLYGDRNTSFEIIQALDQLPVYRIWYFVFLSFIISYLDFSAYSDIAIGSSRLFGFRIAENFNYPFLARNLSDFWRRWHMTLISWLQNYVYLPIISYTRKPALAVFVTFIGVGFWHSGNLNWFFWGLVHACGIVCQLYWTRYCRRRKWKFFNHWSWSFLFVPLTFSFAAFVYVFVAMDSQGINVTFLVIQRMFGF